jgi:two-component system, OmpR family, sensor kinase
VVKPRPLAKFRPLSAWTLRTRLLTALIALMAAVSLAVGVVSVLALSAFLEQRVDDQLSFAVQRSQNAANRPPPEHESQPENEQQPESERQPEPEREAPPHIDRPRPDFTVGDSRGGPGFLNAPGQSQGTIGVLLTNGATVAESGVLDSAGVVQPLTTAQQQQLASTTPDSRPHTMQLGGDLGPYRVLAAPGRNNEVLITGLPLSPARHAALRLAAVVTAVGLAGLLAAALAGAAIVRITLRPLRRVAATATQVAELPLDRGEVALGVRVPEADTDQRTEVGQVGAALNRMLGHVGAALTARQASEARVRQFVADASHELRTPLASIRGYAELTRRSQQDVPPDIAHALARVESQAVRMTALVEDLLLLARLDEGRPMERATVDLSRLLVDAVSDAHAAGPEHHWYLDLPDEPVEVQGDGPRLHQVVANLLGNARVHTPPGSTVRIRLSPETTAGVSISVLDDGPGIPPELLPEVFERFARGDSSRSRAAGSTGLGLAIVSAVVTAHGGHTTVQSTPGRTEFTIHLP